MAYYRPLNSSGVAMTVRTICQSKFLVVNLITLVVLLWTIALYIIPLTRGTEIEAPMQPARSFVVPNIVHFIRYGPTPLSFMDAVCILAVLKQQKPFKVYVHTDQQVFNGGKYWDEVTTHRLGRGTVQLKKLGSELPSWKNNTVPDMLITKLNVLSKYGGIYLDNDCYLVNSLNQFRRHELTLGWVRQPVVLHNVIIASSEAKFLKIWLEEAMKFDPMSVSRRSFYAHIILKNRPSLVNWMKEWLIDSREVTETVYLDLSGRWRWTNVIKLFINQQYLIPRNLSHTATYPAVFNETNIFNYNVNIQQMVREVYPLEVKNETLHGISKGQKMND